MPAVQGWRHYSRVDCGRHQVSELVGELGTLTGEVQLGQGVYRLLCGCVDIAPGLSGVERRRGGHQVLSPPDHTRARRLWDEQYSTASSCFEQDAFTDVDGCRQARQGIGGRGEHCGYS